jgi:small subunit ribosomal protein S8
MTNYQVGDFLIRIKNASLARMKEVTGLMATKYIKGAASALKDAGYVDKITEKDGELTVSLAFRNKRPVLMDLKIISRPGLRLYKNVEELEKDKGPFIFLISTSKGVITSQKAIKARLGGEVIAQIW